MPFTSRPISNLARSLRDLTRHRLRLRSQSATPTDGGSPQCRTPPLWTLPHMLPRSPEQAVARRHVRRRVRTLLPVVVIAEHDAETLARTRTTDGLETPHHRACLDSARRTRQRSAGASGWMGVRSDTGGCPLD